MRPGFRCDVAEGVLVGDSILWEAELAELLHIAQSGIADNR